ncbi:MAG: MaoC family dehydratase [Pseudomonadota bacterium]
MATLSVGERHAVTKTIAEADVYSYAGIVGDFHPNHVDAVYAEKHLGARVAHGALLPGFISRAAVELIGERLSPPGYAAQTFSIKLIAPVFFGDTITTTVEVVELNTERRKVRFEAVIANQEGKTCALGDKVVKVLRSISEEAVEGAR